MPELNEARLRVQALADYSTTIEHLVAAGLAGRITWEKVERLAHAADVRESWGEAVRRRAEIDVEDLDLGLVEESLRYAAPPAQEGRRG